MPGFTNLGDRNKLFLQLKSTLAFSESGTIKKAIVDKGAFLVSENIEALLTTASVRKETLYESGLQFVRRKTTEGQCYFINNRSDKAVDQWVSVNSNAASVALFSPMFAKKDWQNGRKEVMG